MAMMRTDEPDTDTPPPEMRAAIIKELRAACEVMRRDHGTQCAIGAIALGLSLPVMVQGRKLPRGMPKEIRPFYSPVISPAARRGGETLTLGWMMTHDVIAALTTRPDFATPARIDHLVEDFPAAAFVIAERRSIALNARNREEWHAMMDFEGIAADVVGKEWLKRQLSQPKGPT